MADLGLSTVAKFPFTMPNASESPGQESTSTQLPSSPPQPFPELESDLAFELARLSLTFAHEVDLHSCFNALTLPELADGVGDEDVPPGVMELQVFWVDAEGAREADEDMREATERALEWARMLSGESSTGESGKETVVKGDIEEETVSSTNNKKQ
ncbi:hypothetical protein Q7P37_011229 [Cladosporium fusiforme]